MSLTHFFAFCLLFAVLDSVFGATCNNSNTATCTATTYTTANCDTSTKVCTCKSGSFAIPTGCGPKLLTPTLSKPDGYSNVVLEGKSATLTCTSTDGATLFEWTLNDNVISGATTSTYTISSAATASVGNYKCRAKVSGISSMDSDSSNQITLELLLKTASTIPTKPTVYLPTNTIFKDKTVNVSCNNVPFGYDPNKVLITDGASATVVSPLQINDTTQGKPVKCELTDTTAHSGKLVGEATNLPTYATDITGVTLTSTASNSGVYPKEATITFMCDTVPKSIYVDTAIKPITWAWLKENTVIPMATTQTYSLPLDEVTSAIKCRASTATSTSLDSNTITVTRNSSYVTKPNIIANPTTPVLFSRLTLACGGTEVDKAQYSWKKDNTDIVRQFEQIIQIDNLTTSDNGAYVCTVKKSEVTQVSDTFTVKLSGAPDMVKVSMFVLALTLLMSKVLA